MILDAADTSAALMASLLALKRLSSPPSSTPRSAPWELDAHASAPLDASAPRVSAMQWARAPFIRGPFVDTPCAHKQTRKDGRQAAKHRLTILSHHHYCALTGMLSFSPPCHAISDADDVAFSHGVLDVGQLYFARAFKAVNATISHSRFARVTSRLTIASHAPTAIQMLSSASPAYYKP